MKYNTQDIERVAGRISALSAEVTSAANGRLHHMADELNVHFKGEAAHELQVSLKGLFSDIHSCGNSLSRLSQILYAYAQRLKEADEKSSSNISQR